MVNSIIANPCESWGRKATGLKECPMVAGLPKVIFLGSAYRAAHKKCCYLSYFAKSGRFIRYRLQRSVECFPLFASRAADRALVSAIESDYLSHRVKSGCYGNQAGIHLKHSGSGWGILVSFLSGRTQATSSVTGANGKRSGGWFLHPTRAARPLLTTRVPSRPAVSKLGG